MWVYSDGEGRVCHRHAQVSGSGNWLWLQVWASPVIARRNRAAAGPLALVPAGRRPHQPQQSDGIAKCFGDISQPKAYHLRSPRHMLSCRCRHDCICRQEALAALCRRRCRYALPVPAMVIERLLWKYLSLTKSSGSMGSEPVDVELVRPSSFDVVTRNTDETLRLGAPCLGLRAHFGCVAVVSLEREKGRASPQGQGVARMMRSRWKCRTAENLPLLEIPAATVLSCLQFSAVYGDAKALKSWW